MSRYEGERKVSPRLRRPSAAWLPYLALLLGSLAIAFAAIVVKWANVPGTVAGFYRMIIATTLVAIPFVRQVQRDAPFSRRHIQLAIVAGIFFALDVAVFYTAISITSVANATLFGNTSPVWVSLGALIFFKERLRPAFWLGVALAMVGIVVIVGQDFITHPTLGAGDLFGLSAGFFYGTFFLIAQRAREQLSSLAAWWISAAASAVTLFVLSVVFGQPLFGYPLQSYLNLVAVALLAQMGGWLAINYALGRLPASIVSPTLLIQPVVTALLAVPLLGQTLGEAQIVGGLLVIVGIFLVHRSKT